MTPEIWLIILLVLSLTFDFLNGFNDSANVVATIISSRAMSARAALTLAAVANLIGPFIFGVAVAKTIGHNVADTSSINIYVVIAALMSASMWNVTTWYFGIPSSSSHALIGGIIGAVIMDSGFGAIKLKGIYVILIALFTSPVIGFTMGWLIMTITKRLLKNASPKADTALKVGQLPTAIALALSHGTNDAQKTMGIITMGLVVLGFQKEFVVPTWVILCSACAIGLGTALGGWRIIQTLGGKFYKIRPIHSFTSQFASALVIITASFLGGPVSTNQVVSMSIIGAGASDKVSKVRWFVLKEIFTTWILTIPITATLSAIIYFIIDLIFK
ncbi:MAG TPA: inorganic phosphate transporter [Chitinophagales bacterium]|nr:inorganic phosphate transporter [Chitinophagales bacterium]